MIRSLKGKTPVIHQTAFISEASYLIGDIEIGANVSIWPGVVLRADHGKITVGEGTNIQDGTIVHSDGDMDIGSFVTLGHSVVCHARRVGDHSLLGNNCTINDGATVGDWAILASGAVLTEGKDVPDGSIAAGVPAKVIGSMTKRHLGMVDENAKVYIELAKEYKAEGNLET